MPALVVRLPALAGQALAAVLALTALLVLFVVTMDQGSALASVGSSLNAATTHELFHDARHLLGVPCH